MDKIKNLLSKLPKKAKLIGAIIGGIGIIAISIYLIVTSTGCMSHSQINSNVNIDSTQQDTIQSQGAQEAQGEQNNE